MQQESGGFDGLNVQTTGDKVEFFWLLSRYIDKISNIYAPQIPGGATINLETFVNSMDARCVKLTLLLHSMIAPYDEKNEYKTDAAAIICNNNLPDFVTANRLFELEMNFMKRKGWLEGQHEEGGI